MATTEGEKILLDENAEAAEYDYFDLGDLKVCSLRHLHLVSPKMWFNADPSPKHEKIE